MASVLILLFRSPPQGEPTLSALVERGSLVVELTESGVLRPASSIVYRSPLYGREAEVVFLAPEGARVKEGDLVVQLDATELERELQRAERTRRQSQVDLQVAELEQLEAAAVVASTRDGERALSIDETRAHLGLAQRNVERLRREYESLAPLLESGFITREELDRSLFQLEEAETELDLARRRAEVFIESTHPREQRRAELQLAQRNSELENTEQQLEEARLSVSELRTSIEACRIRARQPGLVVYEEHMSSRPRRKVRVGDRVTRSQGIVTIPEVRRMLVETSVREADVYRLALGQPSTILLDAFPDLELSGTVRNIGTLARSSDSQSEGKRFDVVIEVESTGEDLRPEMTSQVGITVGERSDVLLVPVNAVFDRDGMLVSHVHERWGVETRQLQVGETDGRYVEVVAGLTEGERVGLRDVLSGSPVRLDTTTNANPPETFITSRERPVRAPR